MGYQRRVHGNQGDDQGGTDNMSTAGSLAAEADALRNEFAALLDLVGGLPAVGFRGHEANVAAFHGRAALLKQAFARAHLRDAISYQEEADPDTLRGEIVALERELQVKD